MGNIRKGFRRLTPKEYKVFDKEVRDLARVLLSDKLVYVLGQTLDYDIAAECRAEPEVGAQAFTIVINNRIDYDMTLDGIRSIAFHEIMHAIVHDLAYLARTFYGAAYITDVEHRIIYRLENYLYEKGRY